MSDATIFSFPERGEDRLRLALRRLDEALAEQREAVGAWRGELGSLADVTARLDGSLAAFRNNMQHLAIAAQELDHEAARLSRTADLMQQLTREG